MKIIFCGVIIAGLSLSGVGLAGAAHAPFASTGTVVVASDVSLELTLREALLTALENNPALRVQRLNPAIRKTYEEQARAVFDPDLTAQAQKAKANNTQTIASSGTNRANTDGVSGSVGVTEFLPTGTTLGLQGTTGADDSTLYSDRLTSTRVGVSVLQSLLKGF